MMKSRQTAYQLQQIFTVVVLTGLLSLIVGTTFSDTAAADCIKYAECVAQQRFQNPSSKMTSLLMISDNDFLSAVVGIGQDLSTAAESLMAQLPEEIAKEPSQASNLPNSVARAVLLDASTRSNLSTKELRIVQAEPQNWPDGCLGLAPVNTFCSQIVVSGWQVTVEGRQRSFVYRTNDSGSLLKLARE